MYSASWGENTVFNLVLNFQYGVTLVQYQPQENVKNALWTLSPCFLTSVTQDSTMHSQPVSTCVTWRDESIPAHMIQAAITLPTLARSQWPRWTHWYGIMTIFTSPLYFYSGITYGIWAKIEHLTRIWDFCELFHFIPSQILATNQPAVPPHHPMSIHWQKKGGSDFILYSMTLYCTRLHGWKSNINLFCIRM